VAQVIYISDCEYREGAEGMMAYRAVVAAITQPDGESGESVQEGILAVIFPLQGDGGVRRPVCVSAWTGELDIGKGG
jgi:hypothetical protein